MRIQRRRLFLSAVLLCAATGCNEEDIGEVCGQESAPVAPEPIDGESPVSEVVRLERDRACETFQCITHSGLNPYCTRTCELDTSTNTGEACENDQDCDPVFGDPMANTLCVNNVCIDDDCPNGFACRELQTVGTLAGERFCVRQIGCENNFDCGDVQSLECRRLGCIDSCFLDQASLNQDTLAGTVSCPAEADNVLTCEPFDSLPCQCLGGGDSCEDAGLVCQPSSFTVPFPTGIVAQRGVCFGIDQDPPTQSASTADN
ncbi:MAG: hypothetical protein AAF654_04690 [Myxococcota bacterium]